MKKRILALVLCCALAIGMVPTMLSAAFTSEVTPAICVYGAPATTVSFAMDEKRELTVSGAEPTDAVQWQIRAGAELWVDIAGEQSTAISLSYAMLASLLQNGAVDVRCKLTNAAGNVCYTDPITASVYEPMRETAAAALPGTVLREAEAIGEPIITTPAADTAADPAFTPAADPALAPALDGFSDIVSSDAGLLEANGDETPDTTTFTIIINYVYGNGEQAANPWTATVAKGSSYAQNVTSPVVVGYKPDQTVYKVDVQNVQADQTYYVNYTPDEVTYTVKHYQQNVSNDEYTLADTETKTGYTESAVGDGLAKTDYTGFYSLLYDTTTTIAADGSTVVEIYYDRYYYLMTFDLDGGYGVEPIYARYGTPISVGEPTKPGYTFESWTPTLPTEMPVNGGTYKAGWKLDEKGVSFTVVFWYENANDDGYSVAGTYTPADVKPGTEKKSGDYKNQTFTGRDTKHFTYNTAKAETVTVKGDGSTVLNVYYTRNTYTLTFKDGKTEIICGMEEHTHIHDGWYLKVLDGIYYYGGCYPAGSYNGIGTGTGGAKSPTCGKTEHTHNNSCYKTSDLTITAKYQADIHDNFPIKDGNETIWWKVPQGTETYGNSDEQRYLGSIDTMPGENITFEKKASESGAKIYYYVETLNGEVGDVRYPTTGANAKNYKQYKVIDLDYNASVSLTYREEFHPITGFTQGDSNPKLPKDGSVRMEKNNYLYYTRNSYNLKFYNYNAYVDDKSGSVQYEAPLSSYYFEPDYPANLEKNAYVFGGWYTTAGCYEGSEADLNTMTMPASDVILYAKWTPKTHTVRTFLKKGDAEARGSWPVQHGNVIENPPKDPENGKYKFVGWFYEEDGEEKAFDFKMPITKDLDLYAKWSSDTLVSYTIRYAIRNAGEGGADVIIATETKGSALAGTTKTFEAKTGAELYDGYQSGYFPLLNSHSLTFDIDDPTKNEFTFYYEARESVQYKVEYRYKDSGELISSISSNPAEKTTKDAVVTEFFVPVTGYRPDAYQKRLVLSVDEAKNVITFWYEKDEQHAPVQVIHWIQNVAGDGYTEYQSSTDLNAVIDQQYSVDALPIPGFLYNTTKSNSSGTVVAAGLVLNLYYDRIAYPYEFRFLEQGTDKVLADAVTGEARYQAQVTQTAKDIPGYTLVSAENQAINIAIEEGTTAVKNVKTFYYTEQTVDIKYEVVGPTGCGTLDNYQDNGVNVRTGTVSGSTPTAAASFKFVGWYKDEACTEAVDASWVANNKLTPKKTKDLGGSVMGYEAATYYAKFEYDLTDLTIQKTAATGTEIESGQSFIFEVRNAQNKLVSTVVIQGAGTATVKDLTIGQAYTVTEKTSWSWRYAPSDSQPSQVLTLAAEGNAVTFSNEQTNGKWLNGCAAAVNNWAKGPVTVIQNLWNAVTRVFD